MTTAALTIIVGLGNPEKQYKGTRHNMGFAVVNQLALDHQISWNKAKFRAHMGEGAIGGHRVLLVKPQTYMNLSGEAVRDVLSFYKGSPKDLVVVYDDISLDIGQIRVRERGSAGGQKGMKNIILHLDTDEFIRVRVGIGQKPPNWDLADYVTSRFKPHEIETAEDGAQQAAAAVSLIVKEGVVATMNQYNTHSRGADA